MKYIIASLILFFALNITSGQKPKFKKITKEDLLKKTSSIDPKAKAEYLYKGCDVSFEFNKRSGGFDVVYRHHQRIKIYKSESNESANFSMKYYYGGNNSDSEKVSKLEAYTFNIKDGKVENEKLSNKNIYEEDVNKYYKSKKFAFPSVADGSILEMRYTLKSQYYFNINEFYFQADIPVEYVEYTISAPEYFNYSSSSKGSVQLDVQTEKNFDNFTYSYKVDDSKTSSMFGGSTPKIKRRTEKIDYEKTVTTYKAYDVQAIKNEPFVYTMDNFKSSIRHELLYTKFPRSSVKYYTKSWDDIAMLLEDSNDFGNQLNSDYKKYNEFIESVAELDTIQKIQAIHQTIKEQYKWDGYLGHYTNDGIKNMIKSGVGNIVEINLLLVNLLRKAGLEAYPMVSRESKSGNLNISNPSLSQLNYVIGVVKLNGKYIYLDASDKNLSLNMLPKRALNIKGIILNGNKGVETRMNNPNHGKENKIYSLTIDGENLSGKYKQTLSGYSAYHIRKSYDQESDFVTSLDTEKKKFTNCTVEEYNSQSDIKIVGDIEAKGFVQYIDDKYFVDLQLFDENFTNPFKAGNRDFSLFFDNTFSNVNMLKIKIPEGYSVESIPEKLNIATPDKLMTVMINFSVVNGEVAMTKITKLSQDIINPSYYEAIKSVYDQLEAKMKEKIVLTKL